MKTSTAYAFIALSLVIGYLFGKQNSSTGFWEDWKKAVEQEREEKARQKVTSFHDATPLFPSRREINGCLP
jgi:hypothetical protein